MIIIGLCFLSAIIPQGRPDWWQYAAFVGIIAGIYAVTGLASSDLGMVGLVFVAVLSGLGLGYVVRFVREKNKAKARRPGS